MIAKITVVFEVEFPDLTDLSGVDIDIPMKKIQFERITKIMRGEILDTHTEPISAAEVLAYQTISVEEFEDDDN